MQLIVAKQSVNHIYKRILLHEISHLAVDTNHLFLESKMFLLFFSGEKIRFLCVSTIMNFLRNKIRIGNKIIIY